MKKYLPDYIFLLSIAGFLIVADQVSKSLVRANLGVGEIFRPDLWISNYVRILHWKNTGAAFGMFQSAGDVFKVLSMIVSVAILYYFPQIPRQDRLMRLSMGMLLGGAVGNLIDRFTLGYVTDWLSAGNFAIFNVADASISCGVAVLFLAMLVQEQREKKAARLSKVQLEAEQAAGLPGESLESGQLEPAADETQATESAQST